MYMKLHYDIDSIMTNHEEQLEDEIMNKDKDNIYVLCKVACSWEKGQIIN